MRVLSPTILLGAILSSGVCAPSVLAQEQQPTTMTTQSPGGPAHHAANPRRDAKRMARRLDLTPDQESRIEPVLAERQEQVQSVRSDTALAPQGKRARIRSIRQDSDAKVEAILTDTQRQRYEQMKQNHKAAKRQQGGAPAST